MQFSIIIPVYNRPQEIDELLERFKNEETVVLRSLWWKTVPGKSATWFATNTVTGCR